MFDLYFRPTYISPVTVATVTDKLGATPVSVLPIHTYGQSILRKKARTVQKIGPDIVKLVEDLFETMRNAHGIGLAANQVGALQRVLVVDIRDVEGWENVPPMALLNPEVISEEGKWVMEEGCLSIPEIRDDVERAEKVRIRYRDMGFEVREIDAEGLLGRVLLHEIDHLKGVLFVDYLGPVKQKLLKGRLNKIRRGEVEVAYPIVAEGETVMAENKVGD